MHPKENRYNFTQADEFFAFGEKNHLAITGHTLIWHSQLSPWFCVDWEWQNVCSGSIEETDERSYHHYCEALQRPYWKVGMWWMKRLKIMEHIVKTKFLWNSRWRIYPIGFSICTFTRPIGCRAFIITIIQWLNRAEELQLWRWWKTWRNVVSVLMRWGCKDTSAWTIENQRVWRKYACLCQSGSEGNDNRIGSDCIAITRPQGWCGSLGIFWI